MGEKGFQDLNIFFFVLCFNSSHLKYDIFFFIPYCVSCISYILGITCIYLHVFMHFFFLICIVCAFIFGQNSKIQKHWKISKKKKKFFFSWGVLHGLNIFLLNWNMLDIVEKLGKCVCSITSTWLLWDDYKWWYQFIKVMYALFFLL